MIGDHLLDGPATVALLEELGNELHQAGLRGELFIVGGAALALAYSARRATRDVDGVFEPKAAVHRAAVVVARRHGLDDDWLSDAVKGFLPGTDPEACELFEAPGLAVSVPSPQYLLALKVVAGRVDRDTDDIKLLADICGLTTATAVLDMTMRVIGHQRHLEPKVQFLLEELFP